MQVDYHKFESALRKLGQDAEEEKLCVEDLIAIHNKAVELYGGEYGVRDHGLLESVCVAPHQGCFGQDLYPTVFDKAAKYLVDFCRYQIFADGNKRTGVLAMQTELLINGYDINMTNEDIYELAMAIANNRNFDIPSISRRIHDCCVLIDIDREPEYDLQ